MNTATPVYRIKVQGDLDASGSRRLAKLSIVSREMDGNPVVVLTGELENQEDLDRVLNTLYEMHMVVISVEKLAPETMPGGNHESSP